jgi:hypothetical protein
MLAEAMTLAAELSNPDNDKISIYRLVKLTKYLTDLQEAGQSSEVLLIWNHCRQNELLRQTLEPFAQDVVAQAALRVHNLTPPPLPQKNIAQKIFAQKTTTQKTTA